MGFYFYYARNTWPFMKDYKLSGDGIMCKEQKQSNEKVMTKKQKVLLVGGTVVATASIIGLIGVIVWKQQNNKPVDNETKMLRDIALEAGIFDAAISNITRKLDNKRCQLSRYLAEPDKHSDIIKKIQEEILKLEKMLAYAVNKKETMIIVEE